MLAASRSILDRRVLAALDPVDASTGERITAPLQCWSDRLGFVRNHSGLFVANTLHPKSAAERELAEHLTAFDSAPPGLAAESAAFAVTLSDPAGRYVNRQAELKLPRGAKVSEPIKLALYPSPTAAIGQNWAGVRASLRHRPADSLQPLAGARLSLVRSSDDTVLGRGISDVRGEVLAVAVGIPVIDFTAPSPAPSPSPSPSPNPSPAPAATPVGTKKVPVKLIIETAPGQPWPTDPDAIEANGQKWEPVSGSLPNLELETGRILSDGLGFVLKPQA